MKKFYFLPLVSLSFDVSYNEAFMYSNQVSSPSSVLKARPDSSEEIQEALRISKEFGPSSKEARVAWDIVEELDASDNIRKAFELNTPESVGLTNDEKDYMNHVKSLTYMLTNVVEPAIGPIRTLLSKLKDVEVSEPKMTKLGGPLPEVLANALADAKAADDIYGPASLKASDAWNMAEQIAMDMNVAGYSSSVADVSDTQKDHLRYKETAMLSHHDYSAVVDLQSLDDAMDSLMKLEHLTRLAAIENARLSYYFENKQ